MPPPRRHAVSIVPREKTAVVVFRWGRRAQIALIACVVVGESGCSRFPEEINSCGAAVVRRADPLSAIQAKSAFPKRHQYAAPLLSSALAQFFSRRFKLCCRFFRVPKLYRPRATSAGCSGCGQHRARLVFPTHAVGHSLPPSRSLLRSVTLASRQVSSRPLYPLITDSRNRFGTLLTAEFR